METKLDESDDRMLHLISDFIFRSSLYMQPRGKNLMKFYCLHRRKNPSNNTPPKISSPITVSSIGAPPSRAHPARIVTPSSCTCLQHKPHTSHRLALARPIVCGNHMSPWNVSMSIETVPHDLRIVILLCTLQPAPARSANPE
jgi:hypothetical protein